VETVRYGKVHNLAHERVVQRKHASHFAGEDVD
jgi:hypothetical protein